MDLYPNHAWFVCSLDKTDFYFNSETGERTRKDPRLEPDLEWRRVSPDEIGRVITDDDPQNFDFFSERADRRGGEFGSPSTARSVGGEGCETREILHCLNCGNGKG